MPFWFIALLFIGSLLAGELLRPRPKDTSKPATLSDFNFPTADESRPIPVVWGTVSITGANILWYGDLQSTSLSRKVKTGLLSSATQVIGYRYSFGIDYALCWGPVDEILEIRTDNKLAWLPIGGPAPADLGGTGQDFVVDARTIYGGDADFQIENGGFGGVYAWCTFHSGRPSASINSYMANVLSPAPVPAYNNVCRVVWQGPSSGKAVYNGNFFNEPFKSGYMGTANQLTPLEFIIKRCPNVLSISPFDTEYLIVDANNPNQADANPADALLELLTNNLWGVNIPLNLFDIPSFKAAQHSCFVDKLGFSAIWDTPKDIIDVMNELLNYMDAVLYTDLSTGLITIKLARSDYDIENIVVLDRSNCEVTSYSRASWSETTNEVRVNYLERKTESSTIGTLGTVFREKTAIAQDLANFRIQDSVVATGIDYIGPTNGTTASKLAYRDLRIVSRPLIRLNIKAFRGTSILRPADVFKLNWSDFEINIQNQVFRVIKIRYGNLSDNMMDIEAVEDVFSIQNSIYSSPTDTEWVDPNQEPTPLDNFVIEESPYFYSGDVAKLQIIAEKPDPWQLAFNVYTGHSMVDTTIADTGQIYTPMGKLSFDLPVYYDTVQASPYDVEPQDSPSSNATSLGIIRSAEQFEVKNGFNLALIKSVNTEEIIGFESAIYSSGVNTVTLNNLYRGLLDTTPQSHPADSKVYFFTYGASRPNVVFDSNTAYTAFESVGQTGTGGMTTVQTVPIINRAKRPYPPADIKLNGLRGNVSFSSGSNITITWNNRNRIRQAGKVYFQTDADIYTESGTEVYIRAYNQSNTLIATKIVPARLGTYLYTNGSQIADNGGTEPTAITLHIYTKREGLYSYQAQVRTFNRSFTITNPPLYSIPADSYIPRPDGDATYLDNIPLSGIPTNGQVLTYNSTTGVWEPSSPSGGTLIGDVSGAISANTVDKIKNVPISSLAPVSQDVLTFNGTNWEAANNDKVKLFSIRAASIYTANGTGSWQDINGAFKVFTTGFVTNAECTFTIMIRPSNTTAINKLQFRFVLNGFIYLETLEASKAVNPPVGENEYQLLTVHGVFKNIPAGTNNVTVQLNDGATGQNYIIGERRLSIATVKSDFIYSASTPTSIAGCAYWFDANQITGVLNNNPLPTMTDFSGFNRHFTQATSSFRGTYKTSRINGKPAITFDHLQSQRYAGPNFMTGFTQGELFIVIKSGFDPAPDGISTGYGKFGSNGLSVHYPYFTGVAPATDAYDNFGSTSRFNFSTTIPYNEWHIYDIVSDNGAWIVYLDGELIYYSVSNTVGFTSSPLIGGSNGSFFSGEIAEVIIYNQLVFGQDYDNLYNYFNTKYAIAN